MFSKNGAPSASGLAMGPAACLLLPSLLLLLLDGALALRERTDLLDGLLEAEELGASAVEPAAAAEAEASEGGEAEAEELGGDVAHLARMAAWAPSFSGFLEQVEANRGLVAAGLAEGSEAQDPSAWPSEWRKKLKDPKMVGRGAFGKVYVAPIQCAPHVKVAVKEQAFKSSSEKSSIKKEVKLMEFFSGPQFVRIFDSNEGSKTLDIMMEGATGDLGKVIKEKLVRTAGKVQLMVEMLQGIAAMHDAHYIHRDLKPANILVVGGCKSDTPCHAKVADLGLSCGHSSSAISRCDGIGGTPLYMAPETLRHATSNKVSFKDGVQEKNDVWALGMIFYEMLLGRLPTAIASSSSMADLQKNIMGFKIESDLGYQKLQPELRPLIKEMLELRPENRVSSRQALSKLTSVAPGLGADMSEQTGTKLPDCWFGIEKAPVDLKPPAKPEAPNAVEKPPAKAEAPVHEEVEEDGEIIFLTFNSPMTNVKVNMLEKSWDKQTGVIKIPATAARYSHKNLHDGDVIEEIAGVAFKDITPAVWSLIKQGAFGADKNAPLVVKLRRPIR